MKKAKLIKKYDKLVDEYNFLLEKKQRCVNDYCELADMFDYQESIIRDLKKELEQYKNNSGLKNMVTDLLGSIQKEIKKNDK